jgi:S1-C subfamily serine protease
MVPMKTNRKWPIFITLLIIFVAGTIAGMWLKQRPSVVVLQPPPTRYEALETGEAVVMKVYQQLSPAVVNIVATSHTMNLAMPFWMQLEPKIGQGTGFVIDPEGHILTNNHVVADAEELDVTFGGDQKVPARLVARDPVSDIAVIQVKPFSGMAVAPLGDSDQLSVGQRVIAIGNPFGFQRTVTAGFISALNRDLTIGQHTMMGMIQTDAAINPGNSGGPLISSRGEVIAVNTAIYTQSGGSIGIGLALPINRAKKISAQLIKWGRAIYPWIGIQAWLNVTPSLAESMGLSPVSGVLIMQITPGSPAYKAGLRGGDQYYRFRGQPVLLGGDVILSVNGKATPTYDDINNVMLQKNVGEPVRVSVLRGKTEFSVDLTTVPDPRIQK